MLGIGLADLGLPPFTTTNSGRWRGRGKPLKWQGQTDDVVNLRESCPSKKQAVRVKTGQLPILSRTKEHRGGVNMHRCVDWSRRKTDVGRAIHLIAAPLSHPPQSSDPMQSRIINRYFSAGSKHAPKHPALFRIQ
ncbi:hypothetical protein XELAEV_18011571mg [Xenopus laevis]|uniref:Uncharacterized protein n=1 Tax=Xenopus laevis TaxID=8355 RepID=A0A974DL22_XENLA|nr:hypothetical protein XELAEV_18011571mg [Xenopus laevis]